jgi:predicted enzyme related to lactoylglutathione lyase
MIKLDHLSIEVSDYKVVRDWYVATLGLKVEFEVPGRRATALQDDSGFTIFVEQSDMPIHSTCALYFQVEDVEATHRRLSGAGVPFVHPPRSVFWGYGAELMDPAGNRVRLWDPTSMAEKPKAPPGSA